ncbi:MAG TPA: PD-(D/E)XK nuclease-like domain-containing protein [Acidimicrobiales bacterium]|nr:PD-(D/E)XK nuclease-like domain-containing protein [Acidimicrobiales bacterium]
MSSTGYRNRNAGFRSGFCSLANPADSHARCTGTDGKRPCICECHQEGPALPTTITEPGVYPDLPAEVYHAQKDWLSWSQMKHLIPPSTPAHFKAALDAPEEHKRHFDLGKVVHTLTLGDGEEYVVVQALTRSKEPYDATSYDLVSAQRHRDEIYAEGKVPILRHELEAAQAMADSVKRHPIAKALLSNGRPEVSLFWIDPATGVKCRARPDWLPNKVDGRRTIVPDLKSAVSAAPTEFAKAAANFGYYGQHQHYLDGIQALDLGNDPAFLFIVAEKAKPHLVSVDHFADPDDLRLARVVVDHCRRLYAECVATDSWPGYGDGINTISLPKWLHYSLEEIVA